MVATEHARERAKTRIGMVFSLHELGEIATNAKRIKGSAGNYRKATVNGRDITFVCRDGRVITVLDSNKPIPGTRNK